MDTKYEFGIAPDGSLMLIDEVHTPDSSRFWLASSYQQRFEAGFEPESRDKEFVRLLYAETVIYPSFLIRYGFKLVYCIKNYMKN